MMKRFSTQDLQKKKEQKEKIVACTAYDVAFARLVDPHVDIILVGDSLGMVIQGKRDTLQVTVSQMAYHTACVDRGLEKAHLVADMPFLSYQLSEEKAVANAGRLLRAGAQSIKLEGGEEVGPVVERLTRSGIPVMGHIGMTPQSVHRWGGFHVQGKDPARADWLRRSAKILEEKGAYAVVLESIPGELAAEITAHLDIPTIGIGAGPDCDGQILVIYDLLGMDLRFQPKFLKRYANLSESIQDAVGNYAREVKEGRFPAEQHTYRIS